MRAFKVYLNGKKLCTAGIGDDGVLDAMVGHIVGDGHNELTLRVGGLVSRSKEFVDWQKRNLRVGDEVRIKVIEAQGVDHPRWRHRDDPALVLRAKKRSLREMAKELGWKIQARRK
jgi:hypothetical protein